MHTQLLFILIFQNEEDFNSKFAKFSKENNQDLILQLNKPQIPRHNSTLSFPSLKEKAQIQKKKKLQFKFKFFYKTKLECQSRK